MNSRPPGSSRSHGCRRCRLRWPSSCAEVPAARFGLIGVISIDTRVAVPPLPSPPQLLRASSPSSNAAPANFDAAKVPRDERAKKPLDIGYFRSGLRLV